MRHPFPIGFQVCPWILSMALSAAGGCALDPVDPGANSGHPAGKHLLVTVTDWSPVVAAEDPYPPEELGTVDCPDYAWFEEDGALEIDTNVCAHVTLSHPSLLPIFAGDSIRLSMYHQNLWAPSPDPIADEDDDDDGVPNAEDAFPDDPTESADADSDGVGDNRDRFPTDPTEATDGDGDGLGDKEDPDDDNDGVPDVEDSDDDDDGVDDVDDLFPSDPDETQDTDSDGVGDNRDLFPEDPNVVGDADGDGVADQDDAFPLDPEESNDMDGDGIGDTADNCPLFGNPAQVDDNTNQTGDACEAVVALRVGSEEVFSKTMVIPGPASPITHTFVATDDLPVGTPVLLHIRNHGTNTWYLYEISIETPP